ncbi:hypothetical protein PHMEG_00036806 [Phytophthora megakarya]|uniref:Integrase catalytic domain-containing protein n=1 Tax=Phytophthora megakarya TaxID=4795 RepID=A0A225UKU9_9STRA|nr:hypothetical protein PHMEG_00036806 [Phytophthora megakarya]
MLSRRQTIDEDTVATQNSMSNNVEWILDSASDCHVCTNKDLLSSLRQDNGPLIFDWEGKPSQDKGGSNNLLSLDKLENDSYKFIKQKNQACACLRKDKLLCKLNKSRGRYRLESTVQMVRDETVDGLELAGYVGEPEDRCWTCIQSRMKRMSYKRVKTARSKTPYQKLMSDMCYVGEYTYNCYKHFQLAQDEATRYVWGFVLLKRKKEANDVVLKHIVWLLAQKHKIEVVGFDQGKELLNNQVNSFLTAHGSTYVTTNTYIPEENGLVEHMHGVVLSRTCPSCFAFTFAIEVLNISPNAALAGETPYTRRFG